MFPGSPGARGESLSIQFLGHGAEREACRAAIDQRSQDLLLRLVQMQRAPVSIDAIAVRLGSRAFTFRAFGSQRGACACGGQGSLELCDRIENATGEYRGRIIRLGAFTGGADNPRAFLGGLALDEHGHKRITSNPVAFRDDQDVASAQRVQGVSQGGPIVDAETAGQTRIGERVPQLEVETRSSLFDRLLLCVES